MNRTDDPDQAPGDDLRELAPLYALGALDGDDLARFERALATSPDLRADVESFRAAAAGLGEALPPAAPPAGVKASVFARLDQLEQEPAAPRPTAAPRDLREDPAPPTLAVLAEEPVDELAIRRNRRRLAVVLSSAAAAAVLVAGTIVGVNWSGPNGWGAQREMTALAEASDAQQTTAEVPGGGEVTLVWSAEQGRSAVVAEGLDDLGREQTYELWYIDDAGAVSAGTFDMRGDEAWRLLEGEFAPGVAVGITVEPAGGSEQPTSDPVVVIPTSA
ncbi:anti-sigma factor [Agromyces sp. G08B096]|uniref:Regulator of SigK n=1 Tax=Agromyces sp. G08B096 TaxID=3156399 RepID=A0AAU7W807_9MICO